MPAPAGILPSLRRECARLAVRPWDLAMITWLPLLACLLMGWIFSAGLPQRLADGSQELPLVTLGDDFENVVRFGSADQPDYSAADVIRTLLG